MEQREGEGDRGEKKLLEEAVLIPLKRQFAQYWFVAAAVHGISERPHSRRCRRPERVALSRKHVHWEILLVWGFLIDFQLSGFVPAVAAAH